MTGSSRAGDDAGPLSVVDREALVAEYFSNYVDSGSQRWRYALQHPLISLRALNHLMRLPRLTAELSSSAGGRAIWDGLARWRPIVPTPVHSAATVLVLPDSPEEYSFGPRKQTLRRKSREAEKRGVQWTAVTEVAERERLADLADERDVTHPRDEYRTVGGANRALLVHPLMLAAYGADGRPILVSITPTDGQWAILQYFRTLEDSPEASAARYLLTRVLAEHLIVRGVRYLADNASPMGINAGLRHYQRMLGFRIFRVARRRIPVAVSGAETALQPASAPEAVPRSSDQSRSPARTRPASAATPDAQQRLRDRASA